MAVAQGKLWLGEMDRGYSAFYIPKWLKQLRFSAVPRRLTRAAKMGCAAGCANSNVQEPELKGAQGPKRPEGQRPKVQYSQGKTDLIDLKSKTEDLKFRSIFEVAGPGSAFYQPYLGVGLGYNSLTYSGWRWTVG